MTPCVERYLTLTKHILPEASHSGWPVTEDHCFQRIVLDNICGGVWYDHIPRPAYKYMTDNQVLRAVTLCEAILDADVRAFPHTLFGDSSGTLAIDDKA